METVTLGRSGLRASRAGLGGGGFSRLGLGQGRTEREAEDLVRRALDAGVSLIDTAEAYGTETVIGRALRGRDRGSVVLSTKKLLFREGGERIEPREIAPGLEGSLRRLGVEHVDIYHLHGVRPEGYEWARDALVPVLEKLRTQGKIRAIGITEAFSMDTEHRTLEQAVRDYCWDVLMVGFHVLNQSARETVLRAALEHDLGVLCMFAVRKALATPAALRALVASLVGAGRLAPDAVDPSEPLDFLLRDGHASSLPDAAYRFCLAEPGVHGVLTGTGDPAHLDANLRSLSGPPLHPAARALLVERFGGLRGVSAQ